MGEEEIIGKQRFDVKYNMKPCQLSNNMFSVKKRFMSAASNDCNISDHCVKIINSQWQSPMFSNFGHNSITYRFEAFDCMNWRTF